MAVSADIQNGDPLVTSGIDGTYPPGLPVAQVVASSAMPPTRFARITCMPLAGVDSRQLLIVLTASPAAPDEPTDAAAAQEPRQPQGLGDRPNT